ncbi:MAG TPA: CAP domain-containing protein [Acidimicrobiales bacterium]|nr:CAP domain-containing protein [Acidimicrobiales bacterium]
MGRRLIQLFAAVLMVAAGLMTFGIPARADNISVLLADVNALRLLHGLSPLNTDPTLTNYAQNWSNQMAATQQLAHDPNLNAELGGAYSNFGQNVAFASTITIIFNNLVNSAPHLAIMLTDFNEIGIGVAFGGGLLWVTEDFGLKGTTPQTTAAAPPTTSAPVPTSRATTTTVPPPTTLPPPSTSTSTSTTTSTSISSMVEGAETAGIALSSGSPGSTAATGAGKSLPKKKQSAAGAPNLTITTSRPPRPLGLPLALAVALCAVGLTAIGTTSVVIRRWTSSR